MKSLVKHASLNVQIGFALFLVIFLASACGPAGSTRTSTGEETTSSLAPTDQMVGDDPTEVVEEPVSDPTVPVEAVEEKTENEEPKTQGIKNNIGADLETTETDKSGIQVGFTKDGHAYRGNPGASLIIKEYSDYQCPFCARFVNETLPTLEEDYLASGEAVLIYYDFPLNNIHPQATDAAKAARCAGEQGAAAYWAMHDALFLNVQRWSNDDHQQIFLDLGDELGLDNELFQSCLENHTYHDAVEADLVEGTSLGISGTPSFFVNGELLVGAQPVDVFHQAFQTILEGGTLARNEPEPQVPPAAPTPAAFSDDYAGAMGDPGAPVTIVEFTDYQCPFCSDHSLETMPQIIEAMIESGDVYYILKDFPLDRLHPDARDAAVAARCAGEQASYWEMHDTIFAKQGEWAGFDGLETTFTDYALDLGLDGDQFSECFGSGRFDSAIQDNVDEGISLGVSGTPFFFIDGYPLNGARPFEHFELAVQYASEGRLAEAYAPQPQQQEQPRQPSGPVEVNIVDAFAIGSDDAPVTIVEFTDYQCPFCTRHFQETYPLIVENYVETGLVKYVFKDFPLNNIHPQAAEAAEAARCAGDQEAYLGMHDLLFSQQQEWGVPEPRDKFVSFAEELELDTVAFEQCLADETYKAAVEADLQEGISLGVTGTPAFFLNGYSIIGAQPYELFEQAIGQLIEEQD